MFQIAIFVALFCLSFGAPLDNSYLPPTTKSALPAFKSEATAEAHASAKKHIPIVKSAYENPGDGTYSFSYESANSIVAEESGTANGDGTRAHGSYSFNLPNGEHVNVVYTADENGFVAQGSHIPTAPPLPEAIRRALEENAAAEARGIFDDGQYHGEGLEEGQYKEEVGSTGVAVASAKSAFEGYKY